MLVRAGLGRVAERIEVVEVGRRRRWSVEEKLRIVAECDLAGAVPADVARRYDISTGLLYTWKRMAQGRPARSAASGALVPVHVAEPAPPPRGVRRGRRGWRSACRAGSNLKVDSGVDPQALAAVIAVLQRQ